MSNVKRAKGRNKLLSQSCSSIYQCCLILSGTLALWLSNKIVSIPTVKYWRVNKINGNIFCVDMNALSLQRVLITVPNNPLRRYECIFVCYNEANSHVQLRALMEDVIWFLNAF